MTYKFIMPYLLTASAVMVSTRGGLTQGSATGNGLPEIKKTYMLPDTTKNNAFEVIDTMANVAPQVVGVQSKGRNVVYSFDDGSAVERVNGTRAWRNNNPGNLRYYQFAKDHGALGEAGGFAVFPDEETGLAALESLLKTDTYKNLTVQQAIRRYEHKNPAMYLRKLQTLTGIRADARLRDLSHKQLSAVISAIRTIEGWIEGTEKTSPNKALAQQKQTILMIANNRAKA